MLSTSAVVACAAKRCAGARLSVVTATTVVALGTAAGPARAADGFSLQLSGPPAAVVGQPLSLTASGANPSPADYPYPTYLDVELFLPSVVSTCPATQSAAGELAPQTGGAYLAWDLPTAVDATGAFSMPFGLTPAAAGPVLVCGYTAGLAGETLASTSMTLTVQSAGRTGLQSLTPPRIRRAGSRVLCDPGRWSGSPTRFSYAWMVDGHMRRGAHGRTVRTRKLRGHSVQCRVTASNGSARGTAFSQRLAIG